MADTKGTAAPAGNEGAGGKAGETAGATDTKAGGTTTGTSTTAADGTTTTDDGKGGKPAGETSTQAGGSATEPGKDGAASSTSKAPDKYELTLPEGGRVGDEDLQLVEAMAREEGWSNEEAQQFLDRHNFTVQYATTAFLEATKADKEIGGDKLEGTMKLATAALDRVRPKGKGRGDAFRKLLDRTGFGNHPEVVAFMADVGRMMQEDKPDVTTAGAVGEVSHAQKLYGKKE